MEKKESPKGESAVKPVILLPSKKWVLKFAILPQRKTKLIKIKLFHHKIVIIILFIY